MSLREPPPPPAPGTLQGTLVYAVAGRPDFAPAAGARVELLASGLTTTADADGRFVLGGIVQETGAVLASFDADGDGVFERQRLIRIDSLGAGPGRDVSLGQIAVSRNPRVVGGVRLATVAGDRGHGGVAVFVPGSPWATYTADDGSFRIDELAEGPLQVAFFKAGFHLVSLDVTLGAGEEKNLPTVTLTTETEAPARFKARVVNIDGAPVSGTQVRALHLGQDQSFSVDAQGVVQSGDLAAGLYSFSFGAPGLLSIVIPNVGLPPGVSDLGDIVLSSGQAAAPPLSGLGPYVPSDAGVVDAGVMDAGVIDAGSDDAGAMDAGVIDAGSDDAGVMDAGVMDAGSDDAGVMDAGVMDAGMMNPLPIAVITAPSLATPGSQVTLSSTNSSGDFPLSYRWTQLSGPTVTLSANDSPLAHTPRFTAPAAGNVVEVQLVVTDRLGFSSAPVSARIGIGFTPLARFSPDAGTVFSGQVVTLTSTSIDDGGLALIGFDWQLTPGSGGTLTADGGPIAQWRAPVVAFNSTAVANVTLRVTNAVGGVSALASNAYVVTGGLPNNWSIDAGSSQNVNVTTTGQQVLFDATVVTSVPNPNYTVSWSCTPQVNLVQGATPMQQRFVAPLITGPTQTVQCVITATGQPPLDPVSVSDTVEAFLGDKAPPSIVSTNIEATRASRFGGLLIASEPLNSAQLAWSCSTNPPHVFGRAATFGSDSSNVDGTTCGSFLVSLSDFATPTANTVTSVPFGTGAAVPIVTEWSGPWESTQAFDDPRPVVAAMGQVPADVMQTWGIDAGALPPVELLAMQGGALWRFDDFDFTSRTVCNPTCPMNGQSTGVSVPAGAVPVDRHHFGGPDLFVAMTTDGGVPNMVRRDRTGTWSAFTQLSGIPSQWGFELRATRYDAASQSVIIDTWSPSLATFTPTDVPLTAAPDVPFAAASEGYMSALTGSTRTLVGRKRNSDLSWSAAPSGAHTGVTSLYPITISHPLGGVVVEKSTGLVLQRYDANASYPLINGAVDGYDLASWGGDLYLVVGQAGDVKVRRLTYTVMGSSNTPAVDFGGPPRSGFSPPYPVVLDVNPACEAKYPQFAFVNEALVITWQERCAPATQWKVMARTVR